MAEKQGIASLLPEEILSPPRTAGEMWAIGGAYALEVTLCVVLLRLGYQRFEASSVIWAIVTAVVVLQPGVQQSLVASAQRIVANLIGACVGFATQLLPASLDGWRNLPGLVVVVFLCQVLRLEQSLRTACVSLLIVTASAESVGSTALQRCGSVVVGSFTALAVQGLVELVVGQLRRRSAPEAAAPGGHAE
jgi:uncharacterized membrane protein YgaE (UPF0421/DUF939 family)